MKHELAMSDGGARQPRHLADAPHIVLTSQQHCDQHKSDELHPPEPSRFIFSAVISVCIREQPSPATWPPSPPLFICLVQNWLDVEKQKWRGQMAAVSSRCSGNFGFMVTGGKKCSRFFAPFWETCVLRKTCKRDSKSDPIATKFCTNIPCNTYKPFLKKKNSIRIMIFF